MLTSSITDETPPQSARVLVERYGLIAGEALNVKRLSGSMVAKSVHDAGWSQFIATLSFKAAEAGRTVTGVNPAGTTQLCSGCGEHSPMYGIRPATTCAPYAIRSHCRVKGAVWFTTWCSRQAPGNRTSRLTTLERLREWLRLPTVGPPCQCLKNLALAPGVPRFDRDRHQRLPSRERRVLVALAAE